MPSSRARAESSERNRLPPLPLVGPLAEKTTVEKEKYHKRAKSRDRIEQGVPGGCATRRDENLVDFIEGRVTSGNQPSDESPGPVPGAAVAVGGAKSVVEQQAKNEVFEEVRAFAKDVMHEFDAVDRERGEEPAEKRLDDPACMSGGERVGREKGNDCGPEKGGPPSAKPCSEFGFWRSGRA